MTKIVSKILLTFLLVVVFSIWLLQNNATIQKKMLNTLVTYLEEEWDADISLNSCSLNIFTMSIHLKQGHIQSKKSPSCSWNFEKAHIIINPLAFLFKKKLYIYLKFFNVHAHTQYKHETFDLIEHLNDIFSTASDQVNISPRAISIINGSIKINLMEHKLEADLQGSIVVKKN